MQQKIWISETSSTERLPTELQQITWSRLADMHELV